MYRLIYKSTSNREITWDLITNILHKSEERNTKHHISGMLVATSNDFMQIIEGPYESVNDTFLRIANDDRHHNIKLISFEVIDARIFDSWGMKGIGVFDLNMDLEKQLKRKYGEENGHLHFPLESWMLLSMVSDIHMMMKLPEWKQ